jgi:hypothetical protein
MEQIPTVNCDGMKKTKLIDYAAYQINDNEHALLAPLY